MKISGIWPKYIMSMRTVMRKTFKLTHPKIQRPRLVEGVRHEVNKYLKRERKKKLPAGVDFWDFDCKFGHTEEEARVIHVSEIRKCINEVDTEELTSFYLEILAKQGRRMTSDSPEVKSKKPDSPRGKD
jgi:hypothetical protein